MRISAYRRPVLRRWRLAAAVAPLGVALGLAGCDGGSAQADGPGPPASGAGGACVHLDYDQIAETLGPRFAIAAAAQREETYTCVVQPAGASYPDLSLSVTRTAAEYTAFSAGANPPDASVVENLGLVAYTATVQPAGSAGPGIEVGWVAGNARMLVLRYRLPSGASVQDALEQTPKLIALAQRIDYASS